MPNDSLSRPDRANWAIYKRGQSAGLYALALIDTKFTNVAGAALDDIVGGDLDEFVFDMNPKSLDLEEQAAVQITPTQNKGQFIEHQGQIYKNVTIAGTTGLRPNKRSVNIIPVLGVTNPFASPNVDPTLGIPNDEQTGFDRLLALRNLFRRYFDAKEDPAKAPNTVMVWQNGKEGEFYVVEPMVFRTKRDASSPLTYQYEIQLQTIGRVDFAQFRLPDSRATLNSLQRFQEGLNQASRTIATALATINALADRTVGIAQATFTAVLGPARELLNGLTNLTTTAAGSFAIPRNSIALLATNCREFTESINSLQGATNAYKQRGITTQLSVVGNAFLRIARAAGFLVSQDKLFSVSTASKFDQRANAYREPTSGRSARSGGSPTNLANVSAKGGTALATIMGHDNIFSISQRVLGDQARWKELAVLNDLKAPYVDPTGDGKNVLRPGDKILVPVSVGQATSGVTAPLGAEEDPLVARLGRDLLLRADSSAGGIPVFDLTKSTRGDLSTVESLPNLEQAIEIKFSIEQGELPTHPGFGLRAPIGSKALVRTLVGFQMNARASLLADSRISTVKQLGFQVTGNTLNVNANLGIADTDRLVSVSFDARR